MKSSGPLTHLEDALICFEAQWLSVKSYMWIWMLSLHRLSNSTIPL